MLEFRGLPSSRMGDAVALDVITAVGVRRITVDRPGVGYSDPKPGRTLLDWPNDVRALVGPGECSKTDDAGQDQGPG